jgi:hypothetical protein
LLKRFHVVCNRGLNIPRDCITVTEVSADGWKESLISYVLAHGDNLDFTRHFWKGCEPIEADIIQFWKFTMTLRLANEGYHRDQISEDVMASKSTIYTWRRLTQLPKLAHYLKAFLMLGVPPEGCRWITMECSHGYGIPIGTFLGVPLSQFLEPDRRYSRTPASSGGSAASPLERISVRVSVRNFDR